MPNGVLGGEPYPGLVKLREEPSMPGINGIGLAVLARNVVTLDFPKRKMYLQRTDLARLLDRAEEAKLTPVIMPAVQILLSLKKEGRLPGFAKDDKRHGTITAHLDAQGSITADAVTDGAAEVYHYRFAQSSEKGPWELRRAWRTDLNGRTLEEYPVR